MSADSAEIARKNQLLGGLSRASLARVGRDLDLRQMRVRDQIVRHNQPIEGIYFPLSCVLSTVAEGAHGEIVEVATIGNEGMAGLPVFLGVDTNTTLETFTQVAGESLWMRAREFREHLKNEERLIQIMGRYTQALLTQISQASACNRMHAAEERCARWLLMTHDRVNRDEFELTQEFLSQMLGVRRATVSEVAAALQTSNIISYARGIITILNRAALEERSCECYRIIRNEYTRLLPPRQD
jgi:CRP-like cAMP-binding protein